MKKEHNKRTKSRIISLFLPLMLFGGASLAIAFVSYLTLLDNRYKDLIYPRVFVEHVDVGGKTPEQIFSTWEEKNIPYQQALFEFSTDTNLATVSGEALGLGFDSSLIAKQAYLVGRSGNFLSDLYTKLIKRESFITPYFRYKNEILEKTLEELSQIVNEGAIDALFEFKDGRVSEFKPGKAGKQLNITLARMQLEETFDKIPFTNDSFFPITLVIDQVKPQVTTGEANSFGIKERIGMGYSEFRGSIPGRIHNVAHAAAKFHGVLIKPGATISYNEILGDVSQATGFQPAYIIKDGRTILGDGGGVCQVSTTIFRAALNAGLPIIERQAHAYRVHYYEEGGFKPGIDATVFSPSVDLKVKNDTPGHILIQTKVDTKNLTLTIEFFGTSDGRKAEIINHQILSQSPAPPPLYQDDPTLPKGTIKQVDWAASGAKTIFTYKVTRGKDIILQKDFVSNFRPWQAVYVNGTKE